MKNYFNYFTEIEEHFQKRWGGNITLSPLDWVLIEIWKDAGVPLEAVLRGIDVTFEHYERRPLKTKKINSLGRCTQEVLTAAEEMKEAAVGATKAENGEKPPAFQTNEIAAFLRRNADLLERAELPQRAGLSATQVAHEAAHTLRRLAAELEDAKSLPRLEDLERRLIVLEEKLFAVLLTATPDEPIVALRAEADRELAPYRRKMSGPQIDQLQKQYVHKRLLEKYRLPRLSLFYM